MSPAQLEWVERAYRSVWQRLFVWAPLALGVSGLVVTLALVGFVRQLPSALLPLLVLFALIPIALTLLGPRLLQPLARQAALLRVARQDRTCWVRQVEVGRLTERGLVDAWGQPYRARRELRERVRPGGHYRLCYLEGFDLRWVLEVANADGTNDADEQDSRTA